MKSIIPALFLLISYSGYSQSNIYGNLLNFNGSLLSANGHYVEVLDNSNLDFNASQSFSIQFWINPKNLTTTAGESHGIVTKKTISGKGYGIFWEVTSTTNKFKFKLNDGSAFTLSSPNITSINTNGWLHITAVLQRDANGTADSVWMYFDGEEVAKDEVTTIDDVSNGKNLYLMRSASTGTSELTGGGYLDEVRIWNTALTERQVRRTYNEPIKKGTADLVRTTETDRFTALLWSSLVVYHDMEDPLSGYDIFDKSDNSNHGGLFEGPSVTKCAASPCGPSFIIPPSGEKPPTYICITTGNWSAHSTWAGGQVPFDGNKTTVYVKDGAVLTVDVAIAKCNTIVVEDGGTLISDPLTSLQITKHFDVDGTYQTNDGGNIVFDEVGDHTIDGSGSGTLDFFNLELYQNSQLQVNAPINIYGVLIHEDGRVRTGDQITIKSNRTNLNHPYGLIAPITVVGAAPDVVGLIKMELELSSTSSGWRQMAFPFSGDFSDLSGMTLNLNSAPQADQNVFYWDYLADGSIPANNVGWTSPTAISNQTRAYSIYLDDGDFAFTNPITFEGEYNPGDKVYPLSYLNDPGNGILPGQSGYENGVGWNFIPNLFPSLLNTSEMTTDNLLAYKNIHIWDANVQQYKAFTDNPGNAIIAYNNQGTSLAELSSGGIMPFQGFWVKTTDASETSFTLKNDWRGISFLNLSPQQSLKAKNSFQIDVFSDVDSAWDGALVAFDENASLDFKNEEDVYKIISPSNVPSVYIETSNVFASVHTTKNVEQKIKLHFSPNPLDEHGRHHIHLSQDYSLGNCSILLEDLITGEFVNLKKEDYSFQGYPGNSARFTIHYYPNRINIQEIVNPQIMAFNNNEGVLIRFKNIQSLKANVLIINTMGQIIFEAANVSTQEDFIVPISSFNWQTYIVRVVTSDLTTTTKLVR